MKTALMTLGILSISMASWAEPVTPDQAMQQAKKFVQTHRAKNPKLRYATGTTPQLKQVGQVSGLYVFNVGDDNGFVIVSNDDRATPVLGYSDSGSFNASQMPDNMKAWLQGYADQIEWLKQNNISAPLRTVGEGFTAIEPLMSSVWGQNDPFNNSTPVVGGQNCVTGCVATAMAQVMYYHKWPQNATSIPGYDYSYGSLDALSSTTFNWDVMQDDYRGTYSTDAGSAVAKLMQYCGWSVKMNYGPSASGASSNMVADALKNYFGYNSTTQYVSRSLYTYENWVKMIYHELSEGRPVFYAGSSVDNGHAFVCDGYQSEDFFHINWGWEGLSNEGFYRLSVLDPENQGTGGSASSSAYSFGQEAVVGIQKPSDNGTVLDVMSEVNLNVNTISLNHSSISLGESVEVTINITNNGANDYDGDVWIADDNVMIVGLPFVIPAGTTMDCVLSFTPTEKGTVNIYPALPNTRGSYTIYPLSASLSVGENTPTDLLASNIKATSADITWTPVGEATSWNLRYKSSTVTTEHFEDGMPDEWWSYDSDGDGFGWELIDGGLDGSKCLASYSVDPETDADRTPSNWIITSAVPMGGTLSFWAWALDPSASDEQFTVYTSENGSNFSSISSTVKVTGTPTLYSFDLSRMSGERYIAIIHRNSSGQSALLIDDFSVKVPSGDWTTIENVTTNPYTLSGLQPETFYEVQMQGVTTSGAGQWSETLSFTTAAMAEIQLANDDADAETKNADIIAANNGVEANVTLTGRTLYKDGEWNTITLPFDMTAEQVQAQLAPSALMTLSASDYNAGTLELTFEDATSIEAGKPYLIKWVSGEDLVEPTFTGVTINNTTADVETASVDFKGNYGTVALEAGDRSVLYLASGNMLYYPTVSMNIGAFRAYFSLNGLTAGDIESGVNSIVLNFDGESTSIDDIEWSVVNGQGSMANDQWYTIDGRRLEGKPSTKGLYIHNGKKLMIQ